MITYKLTVEGKDFTPAEYAQKCHFALTYPQILSFALKHKLSDNRTKLWIEDLFTEINYHEECEMLKNQQYAELM